MSAFIIFLLVIIGLLIIELLMFILTLTVITTGRNYFCGGLVGFQPLCPAMGAMTGIYQGENESCLAPGACAPGLDCRNGLCQTPTGTKVGRGGVDRLPDRPQWCALDTDCESTAAVPNLVNPLPPVFSPSADYNLCLNGFCRVVGTNYEPAPLFDRPNECSIFTCVPGTCVCISKNTDTNFIGGIPYRTLDNAYAVEHGPFGVAVQSPYWALAGFNRESLRTPVRSRNMSAWMTAIILLFVLSIFVIITTFLDDGQTTGAVILLILIQIGLILLIFAFVPKPRS